MHDDCTAQYGNTEDFKNPRLYPPSLVILLFYVASLKRNLNQKSATGIAAVAIPISLFFKTPSLY